jgi:DNA-binding MarR family transcriptional regulator
MASPGASRPQTGRWGYSEASMALRWLGRANVEAQQELARRLGVGITDVAALDLLSASGGPMGPAELAKLLGIRSASATALVDRLEASGHLSRTAHPADRRRIALTQTPFSGATVMAAMGPMLAEIEAAAQRLTPTEAAVVTSFLGEAAQAMHNYAQGIEGPSAQSEE